MATFTVAATEIAAHAKTLTANSADTVTFSEDLDQVEIVSDGAAALYVRVDGTAATVAGPNSRLLPAGGPSSRTITIPTAGNTVVSLISPGAPTYSVAKP